VGAAVVLALIVWRYSAGKSNATVVPELPEGEATA